MNKWIAMGRLCEDPNVTSTASGTTIAKFSLAVDRKYKTDNGPTADFFPCTAFGKTAEICEKYLKKGSRIAVVGEPQNNNYTDKNGNKVYGWSFVLNEIDFAESKGETKKEEPKNNFLSVPDGLIEELPFS
jgi:single-strand DNA-binding protein